MDVPLDELRQYIQWNSHRVPSEADAFQDAVVEYLETGDEPLKVARRVVSRIRRDYLKRIRRDDRRLRRRTAPVEEDQLPIDDWLGSLSPVDRQVARLLLDGFSISDIASEMRATYKSVWQVTKRLQDHLKGGRIP